MRILARKIICEGRTYGLSVVEISDDRRTIEIQPFSEETANTTYYSGTIEVLKDHEERFYLNFIPHR